MIYDKLTHPDWFQGADAIAGVGVNAVVFVALTHLFPNKAAL